MKKRILKRKKKIIVYKKRKGIGRAATLAAAVCLFLTAAVPVWGKEPESLSGQAPKTVITNINHRHMGNASALGGCYNVPIKHEHIGSKETGGECYKIQVPHNHQGNESEEGGCYVVAVTHDHIGDETNGGPCYGPAETHTHTADCFVEDICMFSFTPEEVIGTEQKKCHQHQETTFVTARGSETHDSCSKGTASGEWTYCQICGPISPQIHEFSKEVCGMKEGQVLRYEIVCPKKVERYKIGCGKENGDPDSYRISCEKEVDGYKLGCGFKENELCGRLIVTNETAGKEEKVTLSVRVEDLTGGKLKLSDHPYVWKDESGNRLGEGERIQVDENGTYFVTVKLENKDVDEKGLSSEILVDNIYKAQTGTPSEKPEVTSTPSPTSKPFPTSKPSPISTPSPTSNPSSSNTPVPSDTPSPVDSPAPSGTPKSDSESDKSDALGDSGTNGSEENGNDTGIADENSHQKKKEETKVLGSEGEDGSKIGSSMKKFTGHMPENTPSPSPALKKTVQKETKEVTIPEKKAAGEEQYKVGQKGKESGFFDAPAVRIISITAGLALLLLGIFLLLLYLRNSVRVYNDDGKGRMIYLGRCMVEEEEDAYAVTITDAMVEKAYTNRYCIKPGLFLLGRKEGEELIVHKESKRIAVYLSKEMIVML